MIRVSCPKCKTILQVDDQHAGQVIACSSCKTSLRLPQAPAASPPPPAASNKPASPPPAPAADWHYMENGQQQGPVTAEQLRVLITPSDLVWKEGLPEWVPASTIPNLLPKRSSPPPTPAPPPVVPDAPPGVAEKILPSASPKDPILMGVLSFFIAWLGQILIGQVTKGIVMLLVTPFLFGIFVIATLGMGLAVLPFLNLIAAIDAYMLAKKLKEGRAIGKWEFFGIESAPSLAMPDLLPKATDQGGKPVVTVKPRPPGLVGSALGMLFVSGLAMMITLLGVVALVTDSVSAITQILIALSFVLNAWVIFAIFQMMKMQRYAFAITAPLLVMGSWMWLTFSGIPIGLSVIGILGGISVGVWSLGVLRQLEVRAAFANQYDPLETMLPMAKATIQGQSPNLEALKGLFKQLLGSKIALGIAGVVILCLLAVPLYSLLGPSQHKSKFLGAAPEVPKNKKDRTAKNGKKQVQDDDYTRNLPASEATTLVKRYIELSRSVPDGDERREMSQLLNTLVSHGAGAAPVTVALAKRYVELSESVPDEAEQKEMAEILSAFGRLGVRARSASAILTARYNELSESVPDERERREMTLILQTTSKIR